MKPKLLKREASDYLREKYGLIESPRTLDNKAWSGAGPRFYKAGARRLYDPDDLDAYAISKLGEPRQSTSEAPIPTAAAQPKGASANDHSPARRRRPRAA